MTSTSSVKNRIPLTVNFSSSGSGPLTLFNNVRFNRSDSVTVANAIGTFGSFAADVEQAGSGTLTLTGTNTFNGRVTVTDGTLAIGSDAALGALPAAAVPDRLTLAGGGLRALAGDVRACIAQCLLPAGCVVVEEGLERAGDVLMAIGEVLRFGLGRQHDLPP